MQCSRRAKRLDHSPVYLRVGYQMSHYEAHVPARYIKHEGSAAAALSINGSDNRFSVGEWVELQPTSVNQRHQHLPVDERPRQTQYYRGKIRKVHSGAAQHADDAKSNTVERDGA